MTISQFPLPAGGIPTGDTAGRPANPVIGDVYYNGELGILEIFDGTNFIACSAPPGPPTVVSAVDVGTDRVYGSAQATVTLAANDTGGPTLNYQAIGTIGALEYVSAITSATTVSLTVGDAGTYSIAGKGINNFGASITGPATSVALTTIPQAPTIGTATASTSANEVTVTWTLNATGGKNLSAITITPFLNGTTAQTSQTAATTSSTSYTFTVGQLTGGASYTFKVKTTNANGTSDDSTASNSVTVPNLVTFLVIAGGGSGASPGGAGGAGGYRTGNSAVSTGTNYTVTVGAGGATVVGAVGNKGSNSVFSTITSTGGGRGTNSGSAGQAGGSGGGGSRDGAQGGGTGNQGGFSPSEGNNGGSSTVGPFIGGGGGGGASQAGVGGSGDGTAAGEVGGNGGNGTASSITGTSVTRAGGGGGGSEGALSTPGSGGSGGGGAGSKSSNNATAGEANKGSGGGGTGSVAQNSGAGGSGVVILRFSQGLGTITIGAGLTGSTATDGLDNVTTITAGSGNVSWA